MDAYRAYHARRYPFGGGAAALAAGAGAVGGLLRARRARPVAGPFPRWATPIAAAAAGVMHAVAPSMERPVSHGRSAGSHKRRASVTASDLALFDFEPSGPTGAVGDTATIQSASAGAFGATAGYASSRVVRPAKAELPLYAPPKIEHHLMKSVRNVFDPSAFGDYPATDAGGFSCANEIARGHADDRRIGQRIRMTKWSLRGEVRANLPSAAGALVPSSWTVCFMLIYQLIPQGVLPPTPDVIFGSGSTAPPLPPFAFQHLATRDRFVIIQRYVWQVGLQNGKGGHRQSSRIPIDITIPLNHVSAWNGETSSGHISNMFTGALLVLMWSDCPFGAGYYPGIIGDCELAYHDL